MPRCLMAKKWKAYPWPDRQDDEEETEISNVETVQEKRKMAVEMEDEEIDVVGDSTSEGNRVNQQTCWGPHSPTAGTTAPSPPPLNASGALYYNGNKYIINMFFISFYCVPNINIELSRPHPK